VYLGGQGGWVGGGGVGGAERIGGQESAVLGGTLHLSTPPCLLTHACVPMLFPPTSMWRVLFPPTRVWHVPVYPRAEEEGGFGGEEGEDGEEGGWEMEDLEIPAEVSGVGG
jgi:hypothetical protein